MSRILFSVAFIILIHSFAYSQVESKTSQIIFRLKHEVAEAGQMQGAISSTGNAVIDLLAQRFQADDLMIYRAGRSTGRFYYTARFPEGTDIDMVIKEFENTGIIEYAEPDYLGTSGGEAGIKPNDQYYSRQWGLKNNGTFSLSPSKVGADIDMESAWEIEQGSSDVVVAIMDSGVKFDHPELTGRFWQNDGEIASNGVDDDGNGYIDDVQGWDYANKDNDPGDDLGHGTNIAGIIAANGNNSIGYAGMDWHCRLMILKGLDSKNSGQYSWWASALYYAADHGARIINLSVGGSGYSKTLHDAVDYCLDHGVCLVVCMMNTNEEVPFYPAAFEGVIAVGSTNPDDNRTEPFFWSTSSGSNYGSHISVVAPGNYIYGLNHQSNTNYNTYWGGTSQATPHVVGLASLLLAQDPQRTPAELKSIIEETAEDQVGKSDQDLPGWDKYYGHGRINAYQALTYKTNKVISTSGHDLKVYPNPAGNHFVVEFPDAASEISIFNATGQLVLKEELSGGAMKEYSIEQAGIYFVNIVTQGKNLVQKLVLR